MELVLNIPEKCFVKNQTLFAITFSYFQIIQSNIISLQDLMLTSKDNSFSNSLILYLLTHNSTNLLSASLQPVSTTFTSKPLNFTSLYLQL